MKSSMQGLLRFVLQGEGGWELIILKTVIKWAGGLRVIKANTVV